MKKLLILLTILVLITGCGKKNNISKQDFIANDELSKNISMRSAVIKDKILLFLTNDNQETVDIEIKIEYYNDKDKKIGSDEDIYSAILHKKEIALSFMIYEEYKYFKVYLNTKESSYISLENHLGISERQDDENMKMVFNIKNNSDKKIDYLELTIIYYKNDEIIGVESEFGAAIKPNSQGKITLSYPLNDNFQALDFDNYKLYINEACAYNKEIQDEV